jgi:phage-related tail protein
LRNLRHAEKQNRTRHHTNKKITLKIQTQTKQTGKTTHKKTTFYYLFIEKMEKEKTTIKELENELKEKKEQLDAIFN